MSNDPVPAHDLPAEISLTLHAGLNTGNAVPAEDLPETPKPLKAAAIPEQAASVAANAVPPHDLPAEFLGQPPGYQPDISGGGLSGAWQRFKEAETTPLVNLGGLAERHKADIEGALGQNLGGIVRGAANVVGGMTSPMSLETLAVMPALGGESTAARILGKTAASTFTSQQALDLAKRTVPAIGEAVGEGKPEEAIKAGTEAVGNVALGTAAGALVHGMTSEKPLTVASTTGPDGNKIALQKTGDVVHELPPTDPALAAVATATLAKQAKVAPDDLQGFANWFSKEHLGGKPVSITVGDTAVSQTTDTPEGVSVALSDRDAHIAGLWHELAAHANLKDGLPLLVGVPHDNDAIAQEGIDRSTTLDQDTPQRRVGGIAGRGLTRQNDDRSSIQKTLDYVRGIASRDPKSGAPIYRNVSRMLANSELISFQNEQLNAMNQEAARAVRAVPNAGVSAKFDMYGPLKEIADTLGGIPKLHEFITAINESRLQGIEDRWGAMADAVRKNSLDSVKESLPDYLSALRAVQEHGSYVFGDALPKDIVQRVEAAFHTDPDAARNLMASIFDQAAEAVAHFAIGESPTLAAWERANPKYKDALAIWKRAEGPNDMFNEVRQERGGPMSQALGPWGVYGPLVAMDGNGMRLRSSTGYRDNYLETPNPHANMATGLSPQYAADVRTMIEDLAYGRTAVAKNAVLDALKTSGIGVVADARPDFISAPNGRKLAVSPTPIPLLDGSKMWVPDAVMKGGLEFVLNQKMLDSAHPMLKTLGGILNGIQMGGQLDLVAHNFGLVGRLATQAGRMGTLTDATFGRIPFANLPTRALESLRPEAWDVVNSPRALANMRFAVDHGVLPARVGTVTYSPEWAAFTGAKLKRTAGGVPYPSLDAMTYGPTGTHIRTILMATDMIRRMNPDIGPSEYFKAMANYGLYTKELEGTIVRNLKTAGAGPFATAGQSMLRSGRDFMLGGGKMPFANQTSPQALGARAEYLLSRGLPSAILGWYGIHYAMTGKWPDIGQTPLFGVRDKDVKPEIRNSPSYQFVLRSLSGNKPGERVIDLTAFNPVLKRGLAATGVGAAYRTRTQGGTWGEAIEDAAKDAINTRVHIATGPAVQAATTAVIGRTPSIMTMRTGGKLSPQLYQSAPTAQPGLPQIGANLKAAAVNANPITQRLFAEGRTQPDLGGTRDERILRFVSNAANVKPVRVESPFARYGNVKELMDNAKAIIRERLKMNP